MANGPASATTNGESSDRHNQDRNLRRDQLSARLALPERQRLDDHRRVLLPYRNGTGYTEAQGRDFYNLVDAGIRQFDSTASDALLRKAAMVSQGSYGRANPMQQYLYLRVSQKEPFDIVYFTPSMTAIVNLDDKSYSLTPELLYTGETNLDLRLRARVIALKCHLFSHEPNPI